MARIVGETGKYRIQVGSAEVLGHNFAEDAAVIGGNREVAAVVKLAFAHSRPARVNFPAFNVAAHHEHAIGVAVIGAAIAVFVRGASEFGHADEDDVAHAIAHVLMKRGNSLPQIAQQIREAAVHAAFVDVMVPAAAIEKGDFEANVRFEKLRNFLKAFSETAVRILRAIFGLVGIRIDFLELVDGLEGFLAHAAERLVDCLRVHGFETAFDGLLRAVKLELIQIGDGNGGRAA